LILLEVSGVKAIIKTLTVLLAIILSSPVLSAENSRVVAKLDGKPITVKELQEYANNLPEKYKKMLATDEGLRKLAEFYIQRKVLLEEAKKEISERDTVLSSHSGRMGKETAYIIAYLSKKVGEKAEAEIGDKELKEYMKEHNVSRTEALNRLLSEKRRKLYRELIGNLLKKHKVEYLVGNNG